MSDKTVNLVRAQIQESADLKLKMLGQAESITDFAAAIAAKIAAGGKLLICGNGGSAADAQHFAAEMVGRLVREREPIPAIALTTDTSNLTALSNDYGVKAMFRRQVAALGTEKDVLLVLSTSGNSDNLLEALKAAREKQINVFALLGKGGGKLFSAVDRAVVVPSNSSQRIQEVHITIIHMLCELIENQLYPVE